VKIPKAMKDVLDGNQNPGGTAQKYLGTIKKVLDEVQDEFVHVEFARISLKGAMLMRCRCMYVLAIDCPRRCRLSVRRTHCLRVHVTINLLRLHLKNSMLSSCNFPVNR
jgi:alkylhydroperoxidase/carboxymuconolactone decarboxylase family protein YurZ